MPELPDVASTQSSWDDFFVYNPVSRHRRRLIKRLIRAHCVPFRTLLDIGCGDGRMLEALRADFGCEIHGLEPNPTSAPERLRGQLAGFYPLDIEKGAAARTFDLITMTEVLEHTADDEAAMANIAAMAGRYLLLTVPAGPIRGTDVPMGHRRHYTERDLRELAGRHGFTPVASFAWGFPFHSLYRVLVDKVADAAMSAFGQTRYGPLQKLVSNLLYLLFFLNIPGRGCQLFYLGEKRQDGGK